MEVVKPEFASCPVSNGPILILKRLKQGSDMTRWVLSISFLFYYKLLNNCSPYVYLKTQVLNVAGFPKED